MVLFLIDILIAVLLVAGFVVWWRKSKYSKKEVDDSEDLLWP